MFVHQRIISGLKFTRHYLCVFPRQQDGNIQSLKPQLSCKCATQTSWWQSVNLPMLLITFLLPSQGVTSVKHVRSL